MAFPRAAILLVAIFVAGCGQVVPPDDGRKEDHGACHGRLARDGAGGVVLTLRGECSAGFRPELVRLAPIKLAVRASGYGRVLDPSSLVALVNERELARADLDVAAKEFARAERLAADQNLSGRNFDTAAAASARARTVLDDVLSRIVIVWGADIADRNDLKALTAALARRETALVRVDLPARHTVVPRGLVLTFADALGQRIPATVLGPAPDVDPKLQGTSLLALVRTQTEGLPRGTFVLAEVELDEPEMNAVLVPRGSVVRMDSRNWVYVCGDDAGTFRRVPVELDHPTEKGWAVTGGVYPGNRVVVEGAQQLLSEEALADTPVAY